MTLSRTNIAECVDLESHKNLRSMVGEPRNKEGQEGGRKSTAQCIYYPDAKLRRILKNSDAKLAIRVVDSLFQEPNSGWSE